MTKRLGKTESYKVKQAIFAFVLLLVVLAAYLVITNAATLATGVILVGFFAVFFFVVRQYDLLITLKEYERAVIFRLGRVSRVGGPGWTYIIPVVESFKIVDLRTQTIDIKPQTVITKDNIVLQLDAVIYLYVKKDPQSVINSVIEVDDYHKGASQFVQATIRDISGGMSFTELVSEVGKFNEALKKELQQITDSWGVSVESVEIQDLQVPKEVESAFANRAAAEQNKLARMQSALASQAEIDAVREAAQKLDDTSLSYFYIKALEKLGEGQSTKFIFPMELTNLVHQLAQKTKKTGSPEKLEQLFEQYAPLLEEYLSQKKKSTKK